MAESIPVAPAVDLRSDTVTRPTPAMREAMASAEVGDDGFGDDPTVNRLQRRYAELTGKEAALFLPSGTMADDDDGTLDPAAVAYLVEGAAHRWPEPAVVCVEDTHLASGGRPWPLDRLEAVAAVGVPVHLDGARLFNAAVATGTSVAERSARSEERRVGRERSNAVLRWRC